MRRVAHRNLEWLDHQCHPLVRGYNGQAYDAAIDELIAEKKKNGEYITRIRPTYVIVRGDEDRDVEVVEYGGKGGTIVVPKN